MLTETVLTMVFVGDFAAIAAVPLLTWPSSLASKYSEPGALRDAWRGPDPCDAATTAPRRPAADRASSYRPGDGRYESQQLRRCAREGNAAHSSLPDLNKAQAGFVDLCDIEHGSDGAPLLLQQVFRRKKEGG